MKVNLTPPIQVAALIQLVDLSYKAFLKKAFLVFQLSRIYKGLITATSREKRILKNAVQLYRYSTEASRGSASQERNATLQTLLKVCI